MLVKRKIGELRVSELRAELEKRNLDNKGLKSALLQRLQKAITDEGGDVDQIEIEMMAAPSPGSKKNSPRIKRISEPTSESEKASSAAKEAVEVPTIPEKSAGGSDDNRTRVEGSSLQASDDTDEQPKQETEEKDQHLAAASLQDEGDLELLESTGNETGSELTVPPDDKSLMHGECDIDATNTENELNQDGLVIKDDINRTEITTNEPEERFMEDDYPDRVEGAVIDAANGAGENIQVKITSEGEFPEQQESDRTGDHPDDEEEDGERSPTDDPDIDLEDDVLDMLDYDIEMPDQSQVDNADEFHESNEEAQEGGLKDDKAFDENGKKDSTESLKHKKDSAATDDEKDMKNLWITGLSATTRASELKVAFSRYGKVVGAKVVTNARSPGSKCYGFVAMATADAAKKCIIHLHKTEMHGRMITVEYTKNDPSTRKPVGNRPENRSQSAGKLSQSSENSSIKELSGSRRSTSDLNKDGSKEDSSNKRTGSDSGKRRLDETRSGDRRNRKSPIIERTRDGTRLTRRPGVTRRESPTEPLRKRLRPGERKVMLDNKRGEMSLRVNVRSMQERRPNPPRRRLSPSPLRLVRPPRAEERPRRLEGRSFPPDSPRIRDRVLGREREPIRHRARDAREEISRRKGVAESLRPNRSMALQASIERDRLLLRKEREERDFLRMERERLERERRQLERDRIERERLEQERLKLEQERKRELEKIEREKEEMKRLQEINRFEQSQRQRALKRMYDGRPHDDRSDGKRVDRDDRRRYENESRERPMDGFYRNDEGSFRPGRAGGPSRADKVNFHDVDRRTLSSHNDTDARYPSGSGRRVEKYERPGVKPTADYDRRSGDGVAGSLSYRHHDKDVSDDRKVVSRDRGRPTGGSFRRDDGPLSKKEAMTSLRGGSASSRPRAGDRDLRDEIRQGPLSGGTRKGSPHRSDLRHRDEPPSGRGASRAEPQLHGNTPIQSGPPGGKPIPTTGRAGMGFQPSSSWPWQERGEANAVWHGATNAIAGAGAPVGRMVAPPIGLPFNPLAAVNPPQVGAEAGLVSHNISAGFPQSRIDNFKPIRRF